MCAIGAEATLSGPAGERRIPVRELYRDDGIRYLTKEPAEILTRVHLPAVDGWRASYRKLRRRGTFDFPVLGVGVCLWFDGDIVRKAEVCIGGAGSHPIAATETAAMLEGQRLSKGDPGSDELIRAAAQQAFKPTLAMDNTDHEAGWRKKMAPIFTRRAIEDCF